MLDGHGQCESYAKRAKELGQPALSITDHGNLHGWPDFYDACKKHDIKPILGLEAYQARKTRFDRDEEERAGPARNEWDQRGPYHLSILAKNMDGYKNLIKLSSRSYLEGYYVKPRIDLDLLSEHAEGLIVLSGCLNGAVQQALLRGDFEAALDVASKMQDIVGKENYFIEIQDHGLEEQHRVKEDTLRIAKMIGAKVVPTGDCHYVHKHDAEAHDAMLCVSTGATVDQENRFKFNGPDFYLKSYEEMVGTFDEEWLENTCLIGEMVNVDLKFGELYFPEFPLPKEVDRTKYLEEKVWEGIKERYGDPIPDEVRERTLHELGVVGRMGFGDYFLVVSDLVGWAKANGIRVGWGRGSAAGSILSYALRITNLDPIKFGLMFERFLVEGRKSMPDIDLDFDDRHREKVINYARERYGADHVAHICTFSQVGAKSAIRDAARVLGYEYAIGDKVAKMVPDPVLGVTKSIEESLATADMAKAYRDDPEARHIIDVAKGLEGVYRQPGIHAAGVIISRDPVTDYVPVMVGGKNKDIIVSQWDMNRVEQNGLLKIDFLGLRNLGVIDMCVNNVKRYRGIDIEVDDIPIDDEPTYMQLKQGNCVGIFQLESPGMRSMMLALQPTDISDVMALISLYRPGPLGSDMDKMFINRKHGREKVSYPHPILKEVLDPSYGVMLYQEDVLNVAKTLAGFTVGEADDLRKAIGKKQMDKIGQFREAFVKGAKTVADVAQNISDKIYSDIEYFGGYGFNRAHAASYAMVSYVTAYLKTHYPEEYMAALLSSVTDSKDKLSLYLNECRRLGLEVQSPSIRRSERDFTVSGEKQILFGLGAIEGMGDAMVNAMLREEDREYTSIYDFLRKCDPVLLNKRTMDHLAGSGAFDEIIPDWFKQPRVDRQIKIDLLNREKDELGIYVTDHPLLEVWDYLENQTNTVLSDLEETMGIVKVAGIITSVKKKTTKSGKKMYYLTFSDLTGEVEVIVFPNNADKVSEDFFQTGEIGILQGTVAKEGEDESAIYKIYYLDFSKMDAAYLRGSRPIFLKGNSKLTEQQIHKISAIINSVNGDSPVYYEYPEGTHRVTIKFKASTSIEVEDRLQTIVALNNIENMV